MNTYLVYTYNEDTTSVSIICMTETIFNQFKKLSKLQKGSLTVYKINEYSVVDAYDYLDNFYEVIKNKLDCASPVFSK